MDLATITEIAGLEHGNSAEVGWREGDAWLAGGTWLFSEPQTHLRRLIDIQNAGWEPLIVSERGLEIAATCPIATLEHFTAPSPWIAAPLFPQCANALLASFKIRNLATVGGNICMSLPAGSMISLTAALHGVCTIWGQKGAETQMPVTDFIIGNRENLLRPGDLMRSIELPASMLRRRSAFRRISVTHLGRSSTLLIGTLCPETGAFELTVTASTVRPIQIAFDAIPESRELRRQLNESIADSMYFDDAHGTRDYRKHMTVWFAEDIRRELGSPAQ
jgi:CO/xanthine dehydrogenase FAD-binding subunit